MTNIEQAIIPYVKVYEAMKCESMKFAFEKIGISGNNDISPFELVKFISSFGLSIDMPRYIYNSMAAYKKDNEQPITEDEKNLINVINQFYKDQYGFEFDVLDCLGLTGTNKVKFDRRKMVYLPNRKNTDLVYADNIYVPLLYSANGKDIAGQAMIKGN